MHAPQPRRTYEYPTYDAHDCPSAAMNSQYVWPQKSHDSTVRPYKRTTTRVQRKLTRLRLM